MDIALHESLNGGELSIQDNDIYASEAIWNQIYLAMFGGNVEQDTTDSIPENTERFDYWGNSFLQAEPDEFLNSVTERTLNNTPLTSAGRLIIQQAVETDLQYLIKLGTFTVEVTFPKVDTVQIDIRLQEPENVEAKQFRLIWRATQLEPIGVGVQPGDTGTIGGAWILRNGIWDDAGLWIDNAVWNDGN